MICKGLGTVSLKRILCGEVNRCAHLPHRLKNDFRNRLIELEKCDYERGEIMISNRLLLSMKGEQGIKRMEYFKSVRAMPDYQLEVTMATDSVVRYNFRGKLDTSRFEVLRDEELFQSVHTDGHYLIFSKEGTVPVEITAFEFMDLTLINRDE